MTTKKTDLEDAIGGALEALNRLREENRMSAEDQEAITEARAILQDASGEPPDEA